MASNKHWPSMFKSKPHQWNHDPHMSPNGSGRTLSTVAEERSNPEPKPRWNPRPEQLRILEAIFHSGMVNPPRDEIRRIRNQLCEFGQVADANVFYWFQNRKSRSKSKKQTGNKFSHLHHSQPPMMTMRRSPLTTSSSSSERSSQNSAEKTLSLGSFNVSSPTASVNQPFLQGRGEFLAAPFLFPPPPQPTPTPASFGSPEFGFPDPPAVVSVPTSTGLFLGDLLLMNHAPAPAPAPTPTKKVMGDDVRAHKVQNPFPNFDPYPIPTATQTVSHAMTTFDHLQGLAEPAPVRLTVFINDVAFEVGSCGFNVREAFGDDAMLLHPSGQPVLTNEWGNTLYPLQHGASYYVIRTLTPSPNETAFHNLI